MRLHPPPDPQWGAGVRPSRPDPAIRPRVWRLQGAGRDEFHAQEIYRQALELQAAGIQLLVLECVPVSLAERITKALRIPVIGIGAGPATDGQILVMHDAFGITSGYVPKFTKNFLAETGDMRAAIRLYVQQVSEGTFPAPSTASTDFLSS